MSFFRKSERPAKPALSTGKTTLDNKQYLATEEAQTMVRKPARAMLAPKSAPLPPNKKFNRVARGEITGDLEEALLEVTDELTQEPRNDDLHMRRYEILKRIGDRKVLAEALAESVDATGRSFYAVKLAGLMEENQDFPSALLWRQRVVGMCPNDADAFKKVAVAYVRVGDLKGAEPAYRRLLDLKKEVDNPLGTNFLEDMTGRNVPFRVELQAMGMRILNQALSKNGATASLLETAGRLATRAGQMQAAIDLYERLISSHEENPAVRTWKGELLRLVQRVGLPEKWARLNGELIADYTQHLKANRNDVRSWIALARLQMNAGENEEALASFKQAIRADAREWQAVYEHGKLLVRMGRSDEAIGWYEDILSPFSSDAPEKKSVRRALERSLAELYFKLGRYQEALEIYGREEDANLRFIAPIYEAVGETDKALDMYKKAQAQAPKDARSFLSLAEYHARRGDWDEVERLATAGLSCADAFEEVFEGLYVTLATAQMNRGDVAAALATMDNAVAERSDSASMLMRKVKLLILARRGKEGKALATRVLEKLEARLSCAPTIAEYWSLLGDCFTMLGRLQEAEKSYGLASQYDAQDASAVRGLGVMAERRNDLEQALQYYRKYLLLDPLNLASLPIKQKVRELEARLPPPPEPVAEPPPAEEPPAS